MTDDQKQKMKKYKKKYYETKNNEIIKIIIKKYKYHKIM